MELKSDPVYTEETITDLEFAFVAGDPLPIVLKAGDNLHETKDTITITFAPTSLVGTGILRIHRKNLLWDSTRTRVIRREVKPAPTIGVQSPRPKTH